MQVIFVGGAQGVGASCLAVQIAEQWIVVDAGVRVDRKSDPLPDLALLEGKDVRAIFVTHAHADHIGALPLLHQAFPLAPIFASRGTALLMEVMLSDALKVMARRAVEEMELPLYPETLIGSMLTRVRPLPVGEPFTVGLLPGITVHASRAGHIAGAVSLGFVADEGSLVVSGDVSITPQRTVQGAVAPPVKRPDLLVLESTYGARLHPNRQAEELRLAQAVGEGVARGGHVLIPSFGLGRGQEILLILRAAQEKGQIPLFSLYVDGLVRRVCSTYMLLPESLSPILQRQIRRGYAPFNGGEISYVRDERDRERILAGPPACIISSSGMLTGGPSAWYAARLAGREEASIFITGYQDEESPGKRLLDLADHKASTLEVGGMQVSVRCQVAKYSLSAHADGSELAAYAASLQPKQIALVHGDQEARMALRTLLSSTEVTLPTNGAVLAVRPHRAQQRPATKRAAPVPTLPWGIHPDEPFGPDDIETLWQVVKEVPELRIVTARELAQIWYGDASEMQIWELLTTLEADWDQRYFVRQNALHEAFRVRGQAQEDPGDVLQDLVGKILLVQITHESSKPVLCRSLEPGASVRVILPRGISLERNRYPLSSIIDVLGPYPEGEEELTRQTPAAYLADLVKAGRRSIRQISAHELAQRCEEDVDYSLGDLCALAGVSGQTVEDRLAMAKLLYRNPLLFSQQTSVLDGEGLALYRLAPGWQEGLLYPEKRELPDQHEILRTIEFAIGTPPRLYRKSVNPETGDVVLYFHFPEPAQREYGEALARAAEEAGVSITIAPNAHQGELSNVARLCLQSVGIIVRGTPSYYYAQQEIVVRGVLPVDTEALARTPEALARAQAGFLQETGWMLQLEAIPDVASAPVPQAQSASSPLASTPTVPLQATPGRVMPQHEALAVAQRVLLPLPHCYKVGVDPRTKTILVRFHFPEVASQRHAELLKQLEAATGWRVVLHMQIHQGALVELAQSVLPEGLVRLETPSLYQDQQQVYISCEGDVSDEVIAEAEQRFTAECGWTLILSVKSHQADSEGAAHRRMTQSEVQVATRMHFLQSADLYRVGVDETRHIVWLHFHFPDIAEEHYAEDISKLAQETGWQIELHPHAHQGALKDVLRSLLSEYGSNPGKISLYAESKSANVVITIPLAEEDVKALQQRFLKETGWSLIM
ncbi:MAG TPA: MBL fold metallo-hydrolase [Ktedonobacteraceae bacterium]